MGLQQDIGELVLKMCEENRQQASKSPEREQLARQYFTELEYVLNNPASTEENDQHLRQFQANYVITSTSFARRKSERILTAHRVVNVLGLCGLIGATTAPDVARWPVIGITAAVMGIGAYLVKKAYTRTEKLYEPSVNTFTHVDSLVSWYTAFRKYDSQLREQISAFKKEQAA